MIERKRPAGAASRVWDVLVTDNKQLVIIAAGVVLLAIVALVAAFFVLGDNGNQVASPTPGATAAPATGTPTATLAPTATPRPGGPIIIQAQANRTSAVCLVSVFLNTGASPIDTGHLKMNIACDGKTYADVWTVKPGDWTGSDGDILLDPGEAITSLINLNALGVPQGKPFTIQVLQDGTVLQETTVTPT